MSISLTKPQLKALKEEAERLGISVGELARRIFSLAFVPSDRPANTFKEDEP